MTRINASIKPAELSDSMLFAEYREIKRIPNRIKTLRYNINASIPKEFTLNIGHETFFRDKLKYLSKRSKMLYVECLRRGINTQNYSESYRNLPDNLYNDWIETPESRELLKQRINQRLSESSQPVRFYGKTIDLADALIR